MLQHKKILLAISGGIAAYKCAHLVRLLVKQGAEVKVIMTASAAQFVTPQTLSVLSKNEVLSDFFDAGNNWNNHVKLAEWADVLLVAPLTANTLAKMANGLCDNLLLTTYLSARSKTIVAPAMDLDMYQHVTVKNNLHLIASYGNRIIPAETGELASGLSGEGRMAEPEHIVQYLNGFFAENLPLAGKKALVNAGPTYEAIDPVRFIGNRSSGKMGIAIAQALSKRGAQVTLVLGPSTATIKDKTIEVIRVESAEEMYQQTLGHYQDRDLVICTAAVADYRPAKMVDHKIKKRQEAGGKLKLELVETKDILKELGRLKKKQLLVGFALETENVIAYAQKKLKNKNLDFVVANSASEEGSGFSVDTNRVTLIDKHNKITKFELMQKEKVAEGLVDHILKFMKSSVKKPRTK